LAVLTLYSDRRRVRVNPRFFCFFVFRRTALISLSEAELTSLPSTLEIPPHWPTSLATLIVAAQRCAGGRKPTRFVTEAKAKTESAGPEIDSGGTEIDFADVGADPEDAPIPGESLLAIPRGGSAHVRIPGGASAIPGGSSSAIPQGDSAPVRIPGGDSTILGGAAALVPGGDSAQIKIPRRASAIPGGAFAKLAGSSAPDQIPGGEISSWLFSGIPNERNMGPKKKHEVSVIMFTDHSTVSVCA